jgi:cell division protein FtsN
VQLGTFSRRDNADRLVRAIAAKGLSARIAGPDVRGRYRVGTAPVAKHEAALTLQQRLAAQGFHGVITASQ